MHAARLFPVPYIYVQSLIHAINQSVYLKQIALIQYMAQVCTMQHLSFGRDSTQLVDTLDWMVSSQAFAHIGCRRLILSSFVPAESARLGVADKSENSTNHLF